MPGILHIWEVDRRYIDIWSYWDQDMLPEDYYKQEQLERSLVNLTMMYIDYHK